MVYTMKGVQRGTSSRYEELVRLQGMYVSGMDVCMYVCMICTRLSTLYHCFIVVAWWRADHETCRVRIVHAYIVYTTNEISTQDAQHGV